MSREKLMAGNWKMYKTSSEVKEFFGELKTLVGPLTGRSAALAVPFTSLETAAQASTAIKGVSIAAQNIYWEQEGAFTGEISPAMIKSTGATMTLIGHSERRQFFGDTDDWVNKKIKAAIENGLVPVMCLGESLTERESGKTFEILAGQLKNGLKDFSADFLRTLILAYEPVWAIGTGKTATPEMAQEVHAFIRAWVAENKEKELANSVKILYGGSVKPDNVKALMSQPDIDGALVGGASLKADSFAQIINY